MHQRSLSLNYKQLFDALAILVSGYLTLVFVFAMIRARKGETMKYLNLFMKGYVRLFVNFYKGLTVVVLGAIAIFAMSQVSGLSVLACVALGWYLSKKYELRNKPKRGRKKQNLRK